MQAPVSEKTAAPPADVVNKARAINKSVRRPSKITSYLNAATKGLEGVEPVVVVDVHMRFGSMVMFMIKWAIASIPALLILLVIGFIIQRAFGGLLIAFG